MTVAQRREPRALEGFVRYLGGFEHLHWLFSQSGPRAFAHAIEVEGTTTVQQWRTALDALQRSQPLFSVQIDVDEAQRPYFRRVEGESISMRIVDGGRCASWETELGRELATKVAADHAPLLRAVLIHGAGRSTFILVAHHSISDGVSMTEALSDLIRALSGESLEPRDVLPSTENLLGVRSTAPPVPAEPSGARRINFTTSYVEPFSIASRILDAELTDGLRRRAREERTTVHGVLCAAAIQAARGQSPEWERRTVRLLSPIDARKQCGVSNTSSMCIGAAIIPVPAEADRDPWRLARHIKAEHAGPTSRAGLAAALGMISDAVANVADVDGALDFVDPVFAYEVGVSNIGAVPGIGGYPAVRLTSMWGPANLLGCDGEQLVGATTFSGRLHLLHTAYSPLSGLLESIEAALRQMCDRKGADTRI